MPNIPPQKFYLGPDQANDLRLQRPYFLVPLLVHTPRADEIAVRERILAWSASKAAGPITDVFILSHGWHRNFFSATAAYDRIVSAFSVLLYRARLPVPETFNPLILTLHWHSDPGDDQWVDPSGRRNKPSFLDNVTRVFERPLAADDQKLEPGQRFISVFEDIFQLFGRCPCPAPARSRMQISIRRRPGWPRCWIDFPCVKHRPPDRPTRSPPPGPVIARPCPSASCATRMNRPAGFSPSAPLFGRCWYLSSKLRAPPLCSVCSLSPPG